MSHRRINAARHSDFNARSITHAVIGPLLAMVVLQAFTLPQTFMLAMIPGLIGVALLMFFLKENAERGTRNKERVDGNGVLTPPFKRAIFAISLFSLANSSDAFLILQAHAAGVSTKLLPLLWAAHHVIKSLFTTFAGSLSDRSDRRRLLVIGWLLYAAIYLVFPWAHSLTFFFVLFIVYAVPFTLTEGAERAWIADIVPADARGKSFGIYYLANGLCVLAGTALFGALYEYRSPVMAFHTGAGLAIFAAIAVSMTQKRT